MEPLYTNTWASHQKCSEIMRSSGKLSFDSMINDAKLAHQTNKVVFGNKECSEYWDVRIEDSNPAVSPNLSTYLTVPYPNQTLKTSFSKTLRPKLKVNICSYRTSSALSEYNFNFKFCRGVFEKLAFKVWLGYGSVRDVDKFGETAVYVEQKMLGNFCHFFTVQTKFNCIKQLASCLSEACSRLVRVQPSIS